ncbi:MAG: YhcH/YjgK/YiaL family protein [Cohnella sp.]|nr:YhcH/YjgK/YiaL family protein [Cohnella sp.]
MIYDRIANADLYAFRHAGLSDAMEDLKLNLLGNTDSALFHKNTNQFLTVPLSEKQYEAHKKYIDIHVVLEGKEYVEISHISCLTNETAYDEGRDIWFGHVEAESRFQGHLEPDYFLVCFPEDTHLVGAHIGKQSDVKKIIYKIAL